jgi:hypothetical protein
MTLLRQDKGQRTCADAFLKAIRGLGSPPIPAIEIYEISRVAILLGCGLVSAMP